MIQLKVYNDEAKLEQFWIDLYETSPIKLTLSIEDITNAEATSVFSKAFKVPGTRANAEFFKNSFDVDGILYDVTVKKPAEILVDGAEFRQGHIRLQKIFLNTEQDRYDYELLFLGETRDFSSKIGDKGLCQLDLPELVGDATGQNITVAAVQASWQAFPENASLTAGLHDGNIIYPLIDHGNSYNDAGNPNETRIALDDPSQDHFTRSTGTNPLQIARMKPMIRAKRIIDQIFLDAGYTYTSTFFDSDLFHQIYISAFGNEATVSYEAAGNSTSSINCAFGEDLVSTQGANAVLQIPYNQIDPGNNLSNQYYTVPTAGGTYQIRGQAFVDCFRENSDYSTTPVDSRLHLWNQTKNISLGNGSPNNLATISFNVTLPIQAGIFEQGDQIGAKVIPNGFVDGDFVTNVEFEVLSAPGQYNPSVGLECSYKQVDFVKDILTAFRLVLAPDPSKPDNFIVEPWQTYINSGELYDWSDKLVENKDVVIEPVFFSQSETIKYDMQQGGDYVNIYHKQAYSENYGYLEFNSGNDLLKGSRTVQLKGIAPTPIAQIEGWVVGDNVALPQLHTHSAEDTGTQHLPLKVKTRMLFYNGLQPFTHPSNPGGANNTWYLSGPVANTSYPLVSPYETWPIQPETLNLNWFNDVQYWQTIAGYNENGSTLYGNYWSRYIASLYNKYSRRVTATFILNNIDLNTFSFDDTIFVNGTYYRPEKIVDVQVGAYTEAKVVLVTANDYVPSVVLNQTLTNLTATASNTGCGGKNQGVITITTDGTPGFTWLLDNGATGSALNGQASGAAPYTFDINNLVPGVYTVSLTDSLGRTGDVTVTVPASSSTPPIATYTVTDATDCNAPCNGAISVTPSSGAGAPYTIIWSDPSIGNNFNPTNLCPGSYSFYVVDVAGCTSGNYGMVVDCATVQNVWNYGQDFNCSFMGTTIYKVDLGAGTPNLTDVVSLDLIGGITNPIAGCWRPLSPTTGTPTHTVNKVWIDCETCQGINPSPLYWEVTECSLRTSTITVKEDVNQTSPVVGDIWKIDNGTKCWEVTASGDISNWSGYTMTTKYSDCSTCYGPTVTMYSSESEGLGAATTSCPTTTFTNPIYSPGYTDPALIPIGAFMYSDATFQTPWNGSGGNLKARWYALGIDPTNFVSALASLRINVNGEVVDKVVCP